jgi:soluble lytic murein transglycosylase-like protein
MRFCLPFVAGAVVSITMTMASLGAESTSSGTATSSPPTAAMPAPRVMSVVRTDARTGRLVRSIVVSPNPARKAATEAEVHAWIEEAAKNFEISPLLVDSVVQVESNYNPFAVSPKGAQGLMQLMPATARRFGVSNTFDARQNIEGGVRYLKVLHDTFQDDRLAIAAYNAGEKAVTKYGTVPPYAETVSYVAKVGKKYGQAQQIAAKNKSETKSPEKAQPPADEPRHIVAFLDAEGKLHIATE